MKFSEWLGAKDLSLSELLKILFSMGFLTSIVIVMLISAIGALIS